MKVVIFLLFTLGNFAYAGDLLYYLPAAQAMADSDPHITVAAKALYEKVFSFDEDERGLDSFTIESIVVQSPGKKYFLTATVGLPLHVNAIEYPVSIVCEKPDQCQGTVDYEHRRNADNSAIFQGSNE